MRWKNPWFDPQKFHHQIDGFRNLESNLRNPGDVERWRKERKAQGLPHPPPRVMPLSPSSGGRKPSLMAGMIVFGG
jgi:hypothetical protein